MHGGTWKSFECFARAARGGGLEGGCQHTYSSGHPLPLLQAFEQRLRGARRLPACSEGFCSLCRCHLCQAVRGLLHRAGGQLWLQARLAADADRLLPELHRVRGGHRDKM